MNNVFLIYFTQLLGPLVQGHTPTSIPVSLYPDSAMSVVAYPSARGCAGFPGTRRYCAAGFARYFTAIEEHVQDNCVFCFLTHRDKLSWPEKEQMRLSAAPLRPEQRGCGCPNAPILPQDAVTIPEGPMLLVWVQYRWVWKSSVRAG